MMFRTSPFHLHNKQRRQKNNQRLYNCTPPGADIAAAVESNDWTNVPANCQLTSDISYLSISEIKMLPNYFDNPWKCTGQVICQFATDRRDNTCFLAGAI